MIILFAMINSLAACENALRGPLGPPDRVARGVYAGDGRIRKRGVGGRRGKQFGRNDVTAKHPRRLSGGYRGLDLPSGHRQPETKRAGARRLSSASWR